MDDSSLDQMLQAAVGEDILLNSSSGSTTPTPMCSIMDQIAACEKRTLKPSSLSKQATSPLGKQAGDKDGAKAQRRFHRKIDHFYKKSQLLHQKDDPIDDDELLNLSLDGIDNEDSPVKAKQSSPAKPTKFTRENQNRCTICIEDP